MKRVSKIMTGMALAAMLAGFGSGCLSTTKVTEYDLATGKVAKVTETSEPIVGQITKSTKDKTVFMWESGWYAQIVAEFTGSSSALPNFDFKGGNLDKGLLTIHKDQANMTNLADCIKAARSNSVSMGATGVSSSSGSASATNSQTSNSTSSGK